MRAGPVIPRRRVLAGLGSAAAAAAGAQILGARTARAQRKTLTIMQWRHFIPDFDPWFNDFARRWGEENDTDVIVDNVGFGEIATRAKAEVEARQGHDLIQFVTPHHAHCEHLIDHREIFEECENRYGKPFDFALRNNFNRRRGVYLGFAPSYQPALSVYRRDLWDQTGTSPARWSDVLAGARRIKLLLDAAAGLSLAPEHNGEQAMRAIMYSFGAGEQDEEARPTLRSSELGEALAFVKSLYEQAMEPDVLGWDGASNNRFMLSGEGCFTIDSLSIVRAGETVELGFDRANLALAAVPQGPAARLGSFGFYNYSIWNFAKNPDGAKQFLADYVGESRQSFLASRFQNMPSYPGTVADLEEIVGGTGQAGDYRLLQDVPGWTTNVGHLGGTNPAVGEIYEKGLVARMFADVATGRVDPAGAMEAAQSASEAIFERWTDRGWL